MTSTGNHAIPLLRQRMMLRLMGSTRILIFVPSGVAGYCETVEVNFLPHHLPLGIQ